MPVSHFDVGWGTVVVVVGNSVTNSETLEIWLEDIGVISVGNIELINVVGEVGNVDSGIGLSRNPEIVGFELLELLEEGKYCSQVVLSGLGV